MLCQKHYLSVSLVEVQHMNKYDVAGILRSYSEKVRYAKNEEHLKEIICDLKHELDLRKIKRDSVECKSIGEDI